MMAIVLYYSPPGRDHLERTLQNHGMDVYPIAGRAPHALEEIQRHPSGVVVVDCGADDISLGQTVRQVGRTLPDSLVFMACTNRPSIDVYQAGRRVAVMEDLGSALHHYFDRTDAEPADL